MGNHTVMEFCFLSLTNTKNLNSTKATRSMEIGPEMVLSFLKKETSILVNLKMVNLMDRAPSIMLLEKDMKVSGWLVQSMDKEPCFIPMDVSIRVNG